MELAGAIAELARYTLATDFRNINPGSARVILVEAGDRLLRACEAVYKLGLLRLELLPLNAPPCASQ